MENVPISYRLSKTMDVLMKFEKVPLGLKATAQEAISNLIIRALWKNQLHSEASPSSGQHNFINTSYLTDSYIVFYPQNGICIQKYNFWPKNDGEKWSRKNIFEIPPCRRLLSLTS